MPRGRPRNPPPEFDDEPIDMSLLVDVKIPKNMPVSVTLAKQFFQMAKQIDYKLEHCPICLDELCCANCFTLLPCGHYLCAPCYMRMEPKRCPVCRAE